MAILGGAGNPVGGSFTGPAEALEVIGNHAYAYSGIITDAASGAASSTMLKFTSGNFYFVGHLNFTDDALANDNVYLAATMNGTTIINLEYKSGAVGSDNLNPYDLLIPPYTEFEINWGSSGTEGATVWLVGRIYRTRD